MFVDVVVYSTRTMPVPYFAPYVHLWRRIAKRGVWVHYGMHFDGSAGWFQQDGQGLYKLPEISLHRVPVPENEEEPHETLTDGTPAHIAAELMTLAHEFGHFLSWKATDETTWLVYRLLLDRMAAIQDAINALRESELSSTGDAFNERYRRTLAEQLSDEERTLVLDEEKNAWRLGRPHVPEGLQARYDAQEERGIQIYEYRLSLSSYGPPDE